MLIDTSQSGAVIGRGGEIVKSFRTKTGCALRILPPEELPTHFAQNDRIVQIVGPNEFAVRALKASETQKETVK
jgi:hypothetical protein